MNRVGLRDIAREAGVSVSTVSIALRGDRRVDPKTAENIKAVAKHLGYRPNPHLATLGRRRLRASQDDRVPLACLATTIHPFGEEIYKTIQEKADMLGYSMDVIKLYDDETLDIKKLSTQIYARGYAGLILYRSPKVEYLQQLKTESLSIVGFGHIPYNCGVDVIGTDYFATGLEIYSVLSQKGFKRVANLFLHHKPWIHDDYMRYGGCSAGQISIPESERIPFFVTDFDEYLLPETRERMKRYLDQYQPDCLIFSVGGVAIRYLFEFTDRPALPIATLNIASNLAGFPTMAGFNYDDGDLASKLIDTIDRKVRIGQTGLSSSAFSHYCKPIWYDGLSLTDPEAYRAQHIDIAIQAKIRRINAAKVGPLGLAENPSRKSSKTREN